LFCCDSITTIKDFRYFYSVVSTKPRAADIFLEGSAGQRRCGFSSLKSGKILLGTRPYTQPNPKEKYNMVTDNGESITANGNRIVGKIITFLSVIMMGIGILYVSNILDRITDHFTMVPYCALILMLVLILVFLIFPAKGGGPKEKLSWYDLLFIIMSICGAGYLTFFPSRWEPLLIKGTTTLLEVVLCLMLVVAIIEATRRTVNLSMAIIASFFVIHLIYGSHFPGIFLTFDFSLERIASIFYLRAEGIFGAPVEIACTIVLVFMVFSAILQKSDAGRFILDAAFSLTGRWRGGPAKAAIIGSASLGTMVGATAANIATTGSITIPLMKKTGYSSDFAGGVECVASNGGQIMPPVMGAVAFLIAELLSVPYWSVCTS
jgi:TRAP transporter 4TM/12TM fusion protein